MLQVKKSKTENLITYSIEEFRKSFSTFSENFVIIKGKEIFMAKDEKYSTLSKDSTGKYYILDFFKPEEISTIALGEKHYLVLCNSKRGNKVYSWGKNKYGEVGIKYKKIEKVPTEILMKKSIKTIACGDFFSMALGFLGGLSFFHFF